LICSEYAKSGKQNPKGTMVVKKAKSKFTYKKRRTAMGSPFVFNYHPAGSMATGIKETW